MQYDGRVIGPLTLSAGVAAWTPQTNDWNAVLRRKGGQYELVARMPLDPSLN